MTEKKTSLRPTENRVVIEAINEMEKHPSGLIIPDTVSKERPQKGIVVAVGPGKIDAHGKRIEMEIKVGDQVLFTKYGPTEVKLDGRELLVVNASDVLAIFE